MSPQEKLARLSRLQEALDIPQDVLDSLSGPKKDGRETRGGTDCPNATLCKGDCQRREGGE